MSKLATPVQYEDALDELNTVRPLSLSDKGRIALATPVLCVNPVSKGRPALGKLARCTNQGALLKSNSLFSRDYESQSDYLHTGNPAVEWTYSQKVKGILCGYFSTGISGRIFWCDSTYMVLFQEILQDTWTFLPFQGFTIYFYLLDGIGEVVHEARGFY